MQVLPTAQGSYNLRLRASDGSPDTFMITEVGGGLVYDNGCGKPIGGGSIVIHTK
jgi:hypothetical protein